MLAEVSNKWFSAKADFVLDSIVPSVLACSAGGFWWGEWIYISIGCSGRHLDIVKSWGEVKSFPSEGERKKNWGRGRGRRKKNPPARTDCSFEKLCSPTNGVSDWCGRVHSD